MKKSSVLAIGCGGAGNRLLNEFLELDRRYTGIFMNTNMAEMEDLKHFDRERRCFYIPNADGTGKDRKLAEQYIKDEAAKFVEMIKKFTNQNHIIFLTSANGGTGSKASVMLPRLIKAACPDKTISLIATYPNIDESDMDFENSLDFWEEVKTCRKRKFIDNVRFIDNNKPYTEDEINKLAMKELDDSFNIMEGKLDSSDVTRYHVSNGYNVVLRLDSDVSSIKRAIDMALSKSVYYIPENLECDVLIGNINSESHSLADIREKIECYDFSKFNTKTEGDSLLLIGGCIMPTEAIELVQESLEDLKNRRNRRQREEEVVITRNKKETVKKEKETSSRVTAEDLDAMYEDDSFWD
ncbi:hypothetical protein [Clostridium cuniculi]|uniref:hypothetical protein n=1 Tax=Clostridium cuniculi TaxID=2548455 RepID=UPI0010559FF6|nr:hypothetical protein [Clostridium cuniculi]